MAEPAHKDNDDMRPDIRPHFEVIEGGGETSEPAGSLSAAPNANETPDTSRPSLQALEGGGESTSPARGHLRSVREAEESGADTPNDQVGVKGYTGAGKKLGGKKRKGWLTRRRAIVSGSVIASLLALGVGGFTSFLQVFSLDNYLSTIEERSFVRYQVDMEGRSSKWIQTYIALRLSDIETTDGRMDDNLYFRSTRVDNNEPLQDWYKTMRSSKFEQDVFNKNGIYFTSVAMREGSSITFRPAVLKFGADPKDQLTFQLTKQEEDVLFRKGFFDNTSLTDQYRLFNNISSSVFDNDKAARKAIKEAVNNETKTWQWMKRRHIRKDIQNMTGVRDWKFFENKRNAARENLINMQNKLLLAAIPDNTKSGKFMLCLFGLNDCKFTTDPADPGNKVAVPDPDSPKEGGGEYKPSANDDALAAVDDGTAGTITEDAAKTSTSEAASAATSTADDVAEKSTALITKELTLNIIKKFNAGYGIAQVVDALSRIDKAIQDKKLTEMVTVARTGQAIGFFTTLAIARDQIRANQVDSSEYDTFMEMTDGVGNNAIWSQLNSSDPSGATTSSGETSTANCSEEQLETMTKDSFVPLCSGLKVGGGDTAAQDIENWWNNGMGKMLGPVFGAWRNSLGKAMSLANSAMDALFSPFMNIFSSLLTATGLQATIDNIVGLATGIVAQRLGAGPMLSNPTGGALGLMAAQGAAATNEASMRYQGAAKTNESSRLEATKNVARFVNEKRQSQSLFERYASLDNPSSLFSRQLFAVANSGILSNPLRGAGTFVGSLFNSMAHLPSRFSAVASAASASENGYEIATMSGIETYDFPSTCTNMNPLDLTPQNATNADELGIIPAEELTWDLVNNKERFYERLYQGEPDVNTIKTIYNCAILETSVRGALGAQYGYTDDNSIDEQGASTTTTQTNTSGDLADLGYMRSSSENTPCAAGTTDIGVHDGYVDRAVVKVRLCTVPSLPSSDFVSNPSSSYYVEGGNGLAIVNSKISGTVLSMVEQMKKDGLSPSATSTFRTNAYQAHLYSSLGSATAAAVGSSTHQMGLAIDFRISPSGTQNLGSCVTVNTICTPRNDAYGLYAWLTKNANTYQFEQYHGEFWHWEAKGAR